MVLIKKIKVPLQTFFHGNLKIMNRRRSCTSNAEERERLVIRIFNTYFPFSQ